MEGGVPLGAGRARRAAAAVLLALAIAVAVATLAGRGAETPGGRLGGDLPAFFGAGSIAADGDWDALYDADRQIEAQAALWEEEGSDLYVAYPPQVAAAYRLLVPLGYRLAYLVHTVFMAGALLLAVSLARPLFPLLRERTLVAFAFAVTFYPVLRAVLGGQNSALTLLLLVAVARLEHDGWPLAAGLTAALLLYKPQFGVPLALLIGVGRRWRMLGGWLAGALALYLAGAAAMGAGWIGDWWEQAVRFRDANVVANGSNFISAPGVLEHLLGAGDPGAVVGGAVVTVLAMSLAALLWWRLPSEVALRHGAAAAAIVLVAPQALYYEAGVLLLPIAVLAATTVRRGVRISGGWLSGGWLSGVWLFGLAQLTASTLGVSPLAILPLAVAAGIARVASSNARGEVAPV